MNLREFVKKLRSPMGTTILFLSGLVILILLLLPMLLRDDGSMAVGVCDSVTQSIYINEYVVIDFLKKILCHEITHAAMFSYGVILGYD